MVVHRGGTIKEGRLINVTRCRVAGSDVSVARAANLHQATEDLFYKAVAWWLCDREPRCTTLHEALSISYTNP